MPSRKRSKGQARKGKAANNNDALLGERIFGDKHGRCHHGAIHQLPDTHVIEKFTRAFNDTLNQCQQAPEVEVRSFPPFFVQAAAVAITKYPEALKVDSIRSCLVDQFLSFGACLLSDYEKAPQTNIAFAGCYAGVVMFMEHCVDEKKRKEMILVTKSAATMEIVVTRNEHYLKMRKVMDVCPRSIFRFYSKRLGCSCLDAFAARAKKCCQKFGRCDGCDLSFPRRSLMVCSLCRAQQYLEGVPSIALSGPFRMDLQALSGPC